MLKYNITHMECRCLTTLSVCERAVSMKAEEGKEEDYKGILE
jgi:hypothetical protein